MNVFDISELIDFVTIHEKYSEALKQFMQVLIDFEGTSKQVSDVSIAQFSYCDYDYMEIAGEVMFIIHNEPKYEEFTISFKKEDGSFTLAFIGSWKFEFAEGVKGVVWPLVISTMKKHI